MSAALRFGELSELRCGLCEVTAVSAVSKFRWKPHDGRMMSLPGCILQRA